MVNGSRTSWLALWWVDIKHVPFFLLPISQQVFAAPRTQVAGCRAVVSPLIRSKQIQCTASLRAITCSRLNIHLGQNFEWLCWILEPFVEQSIGVSHTDFFFFLASGRRFCLYFHKHFVFFVAQDGFWQFRYMPQGSATFVLDSWWGCRVSGHAGGLDGLWSRRLVSWAH